MKKKRLLVYFTWIVVVVFIQITACSRIVSSNTNPTKTPPYSTTDIQINSNIIATATPIVNIPDTEDGIKKLIERIYQINPKCNIDILNINDNKFEKPILEFNNSNIEPNIASFEVFEIADNPSHNLRAFIACDSEHCQPKLYLKNLRNEVITGINWSGQIPYRPISHIIWIGDNLLGFRHQNGTNIAVIGLINVKEESFFLYWRTDDQCH